ncbi:MAG TPA: glycosyltransferase family 1 protein [Caldilineales bacterium]|nr:glycosyltransferase family 1 protein [Caldilineales bacterium]
MRLSPIMGRMIIGIDASRALVARRTGAERYSLELINALLALNPDHAIRLYVPRQPPIGLFRDHAEIVILPGRRLWTHSKLGPHTWRHPPDVLFVPSHVLPLIGPKRMVVTVHDLGYEYVPDAHPANERRYLRWSTKRHARIATRIIADSHATKQDLIDLYGADPGRIRVVHLAPDPELKPVRDPIKLSLTLAQFGIPGYAKFLLHVGAMRPRKNLDRLIEAFAIVRQRRPEQRLHLMLAGSLASEGYKLREKAKAMGLLEFIRFPGFILPHQIAAIYSAAAAYVLPSLFEGFGLPALEAQACETPLVCSRGSSLPEIAGEGAVYFDPLSVEEMADAIERVLVDQDLRAELIAKGRENLKRFSWEKSARETLAVLEEAARGV